MVLWILVAATLSQLIAAGAITDQPTSTTLVASTAKDFQLSGGASVTANPLNNLRSGSPKQQTVATFAVPLAVGAMLTSVAFESVPLFLNLILVLTTLFLLRLLLVCAFTPFHVLDTCSHPTPIEVPIHDWVWAGWVRG